VIIQLWYQRSDAESVVLFSPPVDVSSVRDITMFLNVVNAGSANVLLQGQQSLDPSDPNSWTNVGSTAAGSASGNTTGLAGGYTAGTTQPLGPYFRVRATITVSSGGIVWSASAVMRT
jgi:hypothetical protein